MEHAGAVLCVWLDVGLCCAVGFGRFFWDRGEDGLLMLHETTLFGEESDKVAIAVERLWMHCPEKGYYLAFSGGADSTALMRLAELACVPFDAHFNITTVDPPEVLKYIREYHPNVQRHRPDESMWQLIVRHGIPPTRLIRYCCEVLKERGGIGSGSAYRDSLGGKWRTKRSADG